VLAASRGRVALARELSHRLPVAFDDSGRPTAWRPRARGLVFGGGSDSDPGKPELWANLAELARWPRDRALKSIGKNLKERIYRVVEQRK